jgi:hypothetical protein
MGKVQKDTDCLLHFAFLTKEPSQCRPLGATVSFSIKLAAFQANGHSRMKLVLLKDER